MKRTLEEVVVKVLDSTRLHKGCTALVECLEGWILALRDMHETWD